MTHAEEIVLALRSLTERDPAAVFTRQDVRARIGVSQEDWMAGYTAIFQAMRSDQPGGAPSIAELYTGIIERPRRGEFRLTSKGRTLIAHYGQATTWRDAVLAALRRYARRHGTALVTRQGLLAEEMSGIGTAVGTRGLTPEQTLSRVLQDIRDEGLLTFSGDGNYVLLDEPVPAEKEDLPDDVLDALAAANKLTFGDIETADHMALARQRRGQAKLRRQTLANYSSKCAFCAADNEPFLVAAHVSRWGDDKENRGNLANLICMCKPHDALFEAGYFGLSGTYEIIARPHATTDSIAILLAALRSFRAPIKYPPDPALLKKHRERCGLERRGSERLTTR